MKLTQEQLEKLYHMGKAWFILRYYSEHFDNKEQRYTLCDANSLAVRREPRYQETKELHTKYLVEVLASSPNKLGSNRLGITGKEVYKLAKICLEELL